MTTVTKISVRLMTPFCYGVTIFVLLAIARAGLAFSVCLVEGSRPRDSGRGHTCMRVLFQYQGENSQYASCSEENHIAQTHRHVQGRNSFPHSPALVQPLIMLPRLPSGRVTDVSSDAIAGRRLSDYDVMRSTRHSLKGNLETAKFMSPPSTVTHSRGYGRQAAVGHCVSLREGLRSGSPIPVSA